MAVTAVSLGNSAPRGWLFPIIVAAFVAALFGLGTTPATSNANWAVLAVSGQADWRSADVSASAWQQLEINGSVPDGAEIRTGGDGHAVVAKGLDRIEIRPGTSLVVAAGQSSKGALEIYQPSGSATYTVEKRPAGTFSVHTPYLVAIVKGTKFDVSVTTEKTNVSVEEGLVGVSDTRSGDSRDVAPGQRATSSRNEAGIDVSTAASGTPGDASGNDGGDNNGGGNDGGDNDGGDNGGGNDGGDNEDGGNDGGDNEGGGNEGGGNDGGDNDGGDNDGGDDD